MYELIYFPLCERCVLSLYIYLYIYLIVHCLVNIYREKFTLISHKQINGVCKIKI